MICEINPHILRYIEQVEANNPRACPEQHALVAHVRKCFETEDIYTDGEQLEKYLSLQKYFPFGLFPWEEFLIALWDCTYWEGTKKPRWKTVFGMIGRGAGKDGFIAFDSFCSVSPYNTIPHYNVDICANNKDQAITPVTDMVDVLEQPKYETKLNRHFYHTKEIVMGRRNKSVVKGRTNNPKGRDGMRSGKAIFNEVHQYENYDNIKVFITGLGKTAQPRIGFFTSNGDISDGPLDDYLARSRRILFDGEPDKGFLPFICCLPKKDMVHDPANWCMANPSLPYRPDLMDETMDEYHDWREHPEQNGDFITKRMGIRSGVKEISVTDYENIKRTNKPLPDMKGWSCTVGIDYAEITDFASVNLHFRKGEQRFDINHSWLCLQSKDLTRIKPDWKTWAEKDYITLVDDVGIPPEMLTEYIAEKMKLYNVKLLALDHHRFALLREPLAQIGFDADKRKNLKLVRPSDIMQVDPVIQECFNRDLFSWGDNPPLRWAVNNTKRVKSSRKIGVDTGNFIYAKIEAKSRKTDPFMALVASMVAENTLPIKNSAGPMIPAIVF